MSPNQRRAALALLLTSCGDVETVGAGRLLLTPGAQAAVWSEPPEAVTAQPFSIRLDGSREDGAAVDAPIAELFVSHSDPRAYGVEGYDALGNRVLGARSLVLDSSALAESTLPLFCSRTHAFSRPPGSLPRPPGSQPQHVILQGRYWVTLTQLDNGNLGLQGYDLLLWNADMKLVELRCPGAPCAPTVLATAGWITLVLGDTWAIWVDLETGESGDALPPSGLESFAGFAGAKTVHGPSDVAYIVGPTADTSPSDAVLVLHPDRSISVARTHSPRRAASATWADGQGLVIAGGDSDAPAIETLGPGSTEFDALPHPPLAVYHGQLVVRDTTLFSFGGELADGTPARATRFDLGCTQACEGSALALDIGLSSGVAVESEGFGFLILGHDADGFVGARLAEPESESVQALPLARTRTAAGLAILPTGHLGVVGGISDGTSPTSLELVLP